MKIRVIEAFRDKFHHARVFNVGEVVDFEDKRAQDLIERKLAETIPVAKDASDGQEGDKPPKAITEKTAENPKADENEGAADAKKASEKAAAEKIAKARKKLKK